MSEQIEGRNAVLEAFRSGKCVDKLFILDGCQDGPVRTIAREARKTDTIINYVSKERLDQLSETHAHQGVIAQVAAYDYSTVDEILARAEEKGEAPFLIILDNVEDPHNLGAIIRTANLAGAHGVIIPKRRAVGLTFPTLLQSVQLSKISIFSNCFQFSSISPFLYILSDALFTVFSISSASSFQ